MRRVENHLRGVPLAHPQWEMTHKGERAHYADHARIALPKGTRVGIALCGVQTSGVGAGSRMGKCLRCRTILEAETAADEVFEVIEGYVWCDKEGCIHDDKLDPYQYGPPRPGEDDLRCPQEEHRPVYVKKNT